MAVPRRKKVACPARRAFLLGWLVLLTVPVHTEQLPFKTYTTSDGLGSTYVLHIAQDSLGFLWFSTREGLSRFDGYRFTTYNTGHGLPNSTVNYFLETRRGIYWVATNGGGVARFDPATVGGVSENDDTQLPRLFTAYPVGGDLLTNRVNVLYEDRAGQIWAGSDGGVFRLEEANGEVAFRRVEPELPSLQGRLVGVKAIAEDAEGSIWIGMTWGLVRCWPDGRMIHYVIRPSQTGDPAGSLLIDREGRLWVGHNLAGLLVFKPESASIDFAGGSAKRALAPRRTVASHGNGAQLLSMGADGALWYTAADGLSHDSVLSLHQTSDGSIWIGTPGGLTKFDGESFRRYTTAHGLRDNAVTLLAEDRDGNLWLGSPSGATKLSPHGLTTYDEADGLGHTQVHSLYEDSAGAVLALSGRWFVSRFDGERFTSSQFAVPKYATLPWASPAGFLDRAGAWWLASREGLYRFAKSDDLRLTGRRPPEAIYDSRRGLPSDFILGLFEDSRGDIWVGSFSDTQPGISRWERATGKMHSYSTADGLPGANVPHRFVEDAAGRLWLGLHRGGLARLRDGRFNFFTTADGLPAGTVTSLHLDRKGRLWVATNEGGLSRVDDPSAERPGFLTYTTVNGLSSNNVRCLAEDLSGHIYLGTVRGVDRLDPETGRVRHYTTADGLANDFVTAALRDRQGALWFGTMQGLSRLVPGPERPPSPPPIWIASLHVAGVRHPVPPLGASDVSGLELSASQNNIQVEFLSIGFRPGEALRYQYRLEGADTDWGAPSEVRTVTYASLRPGSYRFLVRAVNADGTSSERPAMVGFTIHPPVWQRWWFVALATGLAAMAAYALYRYRVRRLVELEQVRTRIATDLHDDIGASLSQIAILSEVARREVGADNKRAARPLVQIASASAELVDAMSDIVWAINPQRDTLRNLVGRMRRFAGETFGARDVELDFRAPGLDAHADLKIGADVRREVYLILKESVNNAVKHAQCTEASVVFAIGRGRLELTVSDNGTGFTGGAARPDGEGGGAGHGLASMRGRAERLGGSLEIRSNSAGGAGASGASGNGQLAPFERGTTVVLRVPLVRGRAGRWKKLLHKLTGLGSPLMA